MSCPDEVAPEGKVEGRVLQVGVLQAQVLQALAAHPDGLSLPRLCKRLGLRMSVLLRELAWLGSDAIDGVEGPGLVRVEQRGDLAVALLTAAGRIRSGEHAASGDGQRAPDS